MVARCVLSALSARLARLARWLGLRRPSTGSRAANTLISLGLAGLVTLLCAAGYYAWAINRSLDFGEQTLVIQPGDTLGRIAAQLVERDVIAETWSLRLLARKGEQGRHVRSGEYRIPPDTTLRQFLRRIVSGKGQVGIKVTIIEGWTFRQMREQLRRAPNLKAVTATMTDGQIMAELGHPGLHPEGRFFPDTYYYTTGQTDLSIYRQAFRLMRKNLDFIWENRADNLNRTLKNKDEALIMASIIEKESYIAEEQRRIAGVFHNRLQKGMRLQTDPTVIYGLGAEFDGNITRAHLKSDTIYNTYTRNGLPPTPIALPGRDALQAAVRPTATDAYYFVSKGDGRHQFSTTLEAHNKAVKRYIRDRKRG